jgi:NAD(P)H-flavin reductase/hemoglobin-like flavoprotein
VSVDRVAGIDGLVPEASVERARAESPRAAALRASFALIQAQSEAQEDAMARDFYATLFTFSPTTRELFPVSMDAQRSRLLRAIIHVVRLVDRRADLEPFLAQLGRDHRKFGVLLEHYDAVGHALLAAVRRQLGDAWTADVAQAWTETYELMSEVMQRAAAAEPGPASWTAEVVAHERIGRDLALVTVLPDAPVPYRAGQYVSVETPRRPRLWRYFSPAHAPRDDTTITFHVRAVDGGWVSPAVVAHTQVGEVWRIGAPMGRLHVDPAAGQDVLLVAGGTGAAPITALVEQLTGLERPPRTQVFVGARTEDDLYALPGLRRLSNAHPWLSVVPVAEHRGDAAGVEAGTLADVVTRYGAWPGHDVVVCGSPAMTRNTVAEMLVAGTAPERIQHDPITLD